MFSRLLKAAVFGLTLLLPGVPAQARLNDAALRDIRIYISFGDNSGYANDFPLQDDFTRAARLAMQMWEGVFPAMRVKFVDDIALANVIFDVDNHGYTAVRECIIPISNPTGRGFDAATNPGGWIGCSLAPNNLGYINRDENEPYNYATIYFNTKGQPNFRFDPYTYESRQAMWSSYQPATFPPINYNDGSGINGNLGWVNGRFLRMELNPIDREDAVRIIAHEFGHCFGQGHDLVDVGVATYGCPGPNCTSPTQFGPYGEINWPYYGCGTPSAPCTGTLKFGSYKAHHMAEYNAYSTGPTPPELQYNGIPVPPLTKFNFRVLRQDAMDFLLSSAPDYAGQHTYPNAKGLMRLRTSATGGAVALANNWTKAISLAQLANTNVTQTSPYLVTGIYNQGQMQKVAAGFNHVLAIRADGTLWAWGANDKGQLGDGTNVQRTTPVAIMPTVNTWVSVAAGNGFSMALRSDNSLWAWGSRSNGQLGDGNVSTPVFTPRSFPNKEWAAVKTGGLHTVALKTNGTLWTWGYNGYGQLGIGSFAQQPSPVQESNHFNDWVGLAAGEVNSAGQRADGSLWTWGWNANGNVGDATYTNATTPTREAYWLDRWQLPSLGYNFSLNLDREGKMWTWGANDKGQLGVSPAYLDYVPQNRMGEGWVSASAGQMFGSAIKTNGTLWSWGNNASGQLGGGSGVGSTRATPVQEITGKNDWQEVYNGLNTAFGLKQDGTLWAWGDNASGQHGTGNTGGTTNTPTKTKWCSFPLKISFSSTVGSVRLGAPIPMIAEVVGNPASVTFYERNAQGVDSPISGTVTRVGQTFTQTWTNPPIGYHTLVAKATELIPASPIVSEERSFFVENVIITAATVTSANLTTEGTTFWQHFGHASSQYAYTVMKSGVVNFFSTPEGLNGKTPVTAVPQSGEPAMVSHSWTQGTPSAYATGTNIAKALCIPSASLAVGDGLVLSGMNHSDRGTEFVAKIYVYARNVSTTLVVGTNSGDWTQDWNGANGSRVYTIRYRSDAAANFTFKIKSLGTGTPKALRIQAFTFK